MARQVHWIDSVKEGLEQFGLLHKVPFLSGLSTTSTIEICAALKLYVPSLPLVPCHLTAVASATQTLACGFVT